MISLERTKSEE